MPCSRLAKQRRHSWSDHSDVVSLVVGNFIQPFKSDVCFVENHLPSTFAPLALGSNHADVVKLAYTPSVCVLKIR